MTNATNTNTSNLFEKALRQRLRFKYVNGQVNTEDLWELSLEQLNTIAQGLDTQIRNTKVSFIDTKKKDERLELSFEVVMHVITVLLAEREARQRRAEIAAQKRKIVDLMAEKQDEALRGKSLAELQAELDALEAQQQG